MNEDRIIMAHGGGGLMSGELVSSLFLPLFSNEYLERLEDGAVFDVGGQRMCFSTDSYVINPLFFPGGDIGSLAVHGTVNDISMCGGRPLFLSAGYILEEGFPMEDLQRIVRSMGEAAAKAGVHIVTGDTKVVARGAADGVFINTAGIGVIEYAGPITTTSIRPGDAVIVSGTVGDHGAAVMSAREDLGFATDIVSDSAPLNGLVQAILGASENIRCMRDATRGGLGSILKEIATQAGMNMELEENLIPVRDGVRGVCEILGLDPLFIANEGKMVVFCPEDDAAAVLDAMHADEYGVDAACIGRVTAAGQGRVSLATPIGGRREIDLPAGELVPRIC